MAGEILGMKLGGTTVRKVLVEELLEIKEEYYVGFMTDRSEGKPVSMVSSRGGINVGEIAKETPESIAKDKLDPVWGLHEFKAREFALDGGIADELIDEFSSVSLALYDIYSEKDAILAEINPLALTEEGKLVAADAVLIIDDNALFRQPELAGLREEEGADPLVRKAQKFGFDYARLDGNIGIIGNGAGLVMATLDLVDQLGGRPANFLDIGGGAGSETVENALELVFSDPRIDAVLINIFGGITRCDEVARGINGAIKETELSSPLIIRLTGTNEEEGLEILDTERLKIAESLEEATRMAIEIAGDS